MRCLKHCNKQAAALRSSSGEVCCLLNSLPTRPVQCFLAVAGCHCCDTRVQGGWSSQPVATTGPCTDRLHLH